eukprot:7537957-Pyramimonas_sp.AAC.1
MATFDANPQSSRGSDSRLPDRNPLGETACIGDLSAMEILTDADAFALLLTNTGKVLSEAGFGANVSKLEITARAFGAGSRSLNEQTRQGKFMSNVPEAPIKVTVAAKCLDSMSNSSGSGLVEVEARIRKKRPAWPAVGLLP